jgi:hypothetical protein
MKKEPLHFMGFELISNKNKKLMLIKRAILLKVHEKGFRRFLSKVVGKNLMAYPERKRILNRF